MEVRNCKGCGRLFNVINREVICPDCVRKLEDKLVRRCCFVSNRRFSQADSQVGKRRETYFIRGNCRGHCL